MSANIIAIYFFLLMENRVNLTTLQSTLIGPMHPLPSTINVTEALIKQSLNGRTESKNFRVSLKIAREKAEAIQQNCSATRQSLKNMTVWLIHSGKKITSFQVSKLNWITVQLFRRPMNTFSQSQK